MVVERQTGTGTGTGWVDEETGGMYVPLMVDEWPGRVGRKWN